MRERFFSYYIISMIDEDFGGVFIFIFFIFFPLRQTALAVAENVLEPKQILFPFFLLFFFSCV